MNYEEEKVYFEGKEVLVIEVLQEKGIPFRSYIYQRINGKSIGLSFWKCLIMNQKKPENILQRNRNEAVTKHMIERGMPMKYRTLKQFCVMNFIDYDKFVSLLNAHPEESFSKVYQRYVYSSPTIKRLNYTFYGISLKAFCLKFQLDYKYCVMMLKKRPDISLEELAELALLNSYIFPYDCSKKLFLFRDTIKSFKTFRSLEAWYDSIFDDVNLKKCILIYRKRLFEISSAIRVYQKVSFYENGWEELYSREIQSFHQSHPDNFLTYYSELQDSARKLYLDSISMSPENLIKCYEDYYSDYIKCQDNEGVYWGYLRKKIPNL